MKVQLTTSYGDIILKLNPDKAPLTVDNFVTYVKQGHYDGTIFHRVIEDFMIQGGGMDADLARTPDPHSASAQFFINTTDNAFLDFSAETDDGWGYCVFGEVIDGIEVVEKIEEVNTTTKSGYQDVPEETIMIEKAEVIEE